jgi:hypothetical protein
LVVGRGSDKVLTQRRSDPADRPGVSSDWHADVAQLVEHHLAKVRVAGSNPVVRSVARLRVGIDPREAALSRQARSCGGVAEWLRQGPAKPCTRVRFPSPPLICPLIGRLFGHVRDAGSAPGYRVPTCLLADGQLLVHLKGVAFDLVGQQHSVFPHGPDRDPGYLDGLAVGLCAERAVV